MFCFFLNSISQCFSKFLISEWNARRKIFEATTCLNRRCRTSVKITMSFAILIKLNANITDNINQLIDNSCTAFRKSRPNNSHIFTFIIFDNFFLAMGNNNQTITHKSNLTKSIFKFTLTSSKTLTPRDVINFSYIILRADKFFTKFPRNAYCINSNCVIHFFGLITC